MTQHTICYMYLYKQEITVLLNKTFKSHFYLLFFLRGGKFMFMRGNFNCLGGTVDLQYVVVGAFGISLIHFPSSARLVLVYTQNLVK